ncbi:carbohydrate-binding protein [Orenia marismortui]|uniref:Putative carbohydrate-binding protein with starch-binding CBM53 n=1 Tax=Orenia marismortui TaxID=46469 RepID=A0A4R8GU18_9FIRM|nr:carbohydrate-binding protein [Orenia marismortui]TDX45277.1 putative carbohydrate-binding protein with starch-binding CBM53 [Orenia marismortui]
MQETMTHSDVVVTPTPITAGEKVTVEYNGLLNQSGANKVYLHAGVGFKDNWRDITDIEMQPKNDGNWTAQLRVNTTDRFNFCFKDCADNWDNNHGNNWSFEVHNGQLYK